MIFKTERDSFRVLDQNGQVRLVKPHQISMRRDSTRAIATDSEGHELRIGDNVKEVDGEVRTPRAIDIFSIYWICSSSLRDVKDGSSIPTNLSSHSYTIATTPIMVEFSLPVHVQWSRWRRKAM